MLDSDEAGLSSQDGESSSEDEGLSSLIRAYPSTVIESFLKHYPKHTRALYKPLAAHVEKMCKLHLRGKVQAVVSSRVKSKKSTKAKLYSRDARRSAKSEPRFARQEDIYGDRLDFVGVRVAMYFPDQNDVVVEILKHLFDVLPEPTKFDKDHISSRPIYPPYQDKFGVYGATHYWVRLNADDVANVKGWSTDIATKPEFKYYREQLVEIQVRSVVYDAWAEVRHDLIYKLMRGNPAVPERRVLDGFKGLVETGEVMLEHLHLIHLHRVRSDDLSLRNDEALAQTLFQVLPDNLKLDEPLGKTEILQGLLLALGIENQISLKRKLEEVGLAKDFETKFKEHQAKYKDLTIPAFLAHVILRHVTKIDLKNMIPSDADHCQLLCQAIEDVQGFFGNDPGTITRLGKEDVQRFSLLWHFHEYSCVNSASPSLPVDSLFISSPTSFIGLLAGILGESTIETPSPIGLIFSATVVRWLLEKTSKTPPGRMTIRRPQTPFPKFEFMFFANPFVKFHTHGLEDAWRFRSGWDEGASSFSKMANIPLQKLNDIIFHRAICAGYAESRLTQNHSAETLAFADIYGQTNIHAAALTGSVAVVEFLLQAPNFEINLCDKWGQTALHAAAAAEDPGIIDRLLSQQNIRELDREVGENFRHSTFIPQGEFHTTTGMFALGTMMHWPTAFEICWLNDAWPSIRSFLSHSKTPVVTKSYGIDWDQFIETSSVYQLDWSISTTTSRTLMGCAHNTTLDNNGFNLLTVSLDRQCFQHADLLIRAGADLSTPNIDKTLPLHHLAGCKDVSRETLEYWLSKAPDINAPDKSHRTLLLRANFLGPRILVDILHNDPRCNRDARDIQGLGEVEYAERGRRGSTSDLMYFLDDDASDSDHNNSHRNDNGEDDEDN